MIVELSSTTLNVVHNMKTPQWVTADIVVWRVKSVYQMSNEHLKKLQAFLGTWIPEGHLTLGVRMSGKKHYKEGLKN